MIWTMGNAEGQKHKFCPVCASHDLTPFIEIDNVPACCNRLWSTKQQALQAAKGNIFLSFCNNCGHVFNREFNPEMLLYNQEYDNSLHFSSKFQFYATSKASELVEKYKLFDKDVVEIGCGKGEFLDLMCESGKNRGVGFDPSYEDERRDLSHKARFRVIKDLYSEKYSGIKADLVCCRHVLEHIDMPGNFLKTIYRSLKGQEKTVLFFEVPNIMFTLKDHGIWDLIYEHCGYFSSSSLEYLFYSCRFEIISVQEVFGGQFLTIEALPLENMASGRIPTIANIVREISKFVYQFADNFASEVEKWRLFLLEMKKQNKTVGVWGGGSKGVTFVNIMNTGGKISYIVDINPYKHGKYVPGTGQKIVSPQNLKEHYPDVILVMNPIYVDEIKNILDGIGVSTKLVSVGI